MRKQKVPKGKNYYCARNFNHFHRVNSHSRKNNASLMTEVFHQLKHFFFITLHIKLHPFAPAIKTPALSIQLAHY